MVLMMIQRLLLSVNLMKLLILIVLVWISTCVTRLNFVIWLLKMLSDSYPLRNLSNRFLRQIYRPFSVLTDAELADIVWNYILLLQQKLTNVTSDKENVTSDKENVNRKKFCKI